MTNNTFADWLDKLVDIWESRNPGAIIDQCADKFLWFETPFDKPITTKEDLLKEWESVLAQKDIVVTYTLLSVEDNTCLAHWTATFTRVPSDENVSIDGIFQVTLDEQGKCTKFRQWYNSK